MSDEQTFIWEKIEIDKLYREGHGEVYYRIESGFPGKTIMVHESATEGVSVELIDRDLRYD